LIDEAKLDSEALLIYATVNEK